MSGYNLWLLVVVNSAIFILFAFSFSRPSTRRDWRSFGAFSAFRHLQYGGFVLIPLGFLLQWPTLLTVLMFPLLVVMYARLARREEREAEERFGEAHRRYAAAVPRFFPRPGRGAPPLPEAGGAGGDVVASGVATPIEKKER